MRKIVPVIVILFLVGCGSKPIPSGKKETVIVKRGEKVSFGWFYCQIDSVFSTDTLGGKFAHIEASKGIYLVVDVTVGNQGMGPETAETNLFELIAVSGTDTVGYRPDFYAATYLGDRALGESEVLKVDEPRRGYIIFDVPKTITNAWMRLGTAYFFLR
jgi:hypothetical protein